MKWETATRRVPDDQHWSRCGHLYVRIEDIDGCGTLGHPGYKPRTCEWFVEPDDEDRSYRRALATGVAPTVEDAKEAARLACEALILAMQASLRDA